MPLLKQVTDFSIAKTTGRLSICHTSLGQAVKETVDLPLVLSVGDIPGALLRVPTLRQRKEASGKTITVINPAPLETDAAGNGRLPRIACTGMAPIDSARQGERIEGKNAAETAKILYDKYLRNVMEVRR